MIWLFLIVGIGAIGYCAMKAINKNEHMNDENSDIPIRDDRFVKDHKVDNVYNLTREEIDDIHSRGKITAAEKVAEWEGLGLCAPGDYSGSAAKRCRAFYNCHECLMDYASSMREHTPIEFKLCNLEILDSNWGSGGGGGSACTTSKEWHSGDSASVSVEVGENIRIMSNVHV